jgi:hypothetical protein
MTGMKQWVPCVLLAAVLASACSTADTATSSVPTQPTTFAPPSVVETFSGTLSLLGVDTHPFQVSTAGEVDITLTSLDPPTNAAVTLAIGLPSSSLVGQCATVQSKVVTPGTAPQITGHALAGNFCVSVTDPGSLTDVTTYAVTVAHP